MFVLLLNGVALFMLIMVLQYKMFAHMRKCLKFYDISVSFIHAMFHAVNMHEICNIYLLL